MLYHKYKLRVSERRAGVIGLKKKIALIFTGAVSLGSFEAGVASELVSEIQNNPDCNYEIDLIVGTSSGALTGALTALVLAYDLNVSVLKEAWTSINLETLLDLNEHDKSILSSSKVRRQIERFCKVPVGKHPVRQVDLAVVITNLNGVQYELSKKDYSLKAISYEDEFEFTIGPGFSDWELLYQAVQASSAYPMAFEPVQIEQKKEARYNLKYLINKDEPLKYTYADGGIINDQPLNIAMDRINNLLSQVVEYDPIATDEERIFLLIEPNPPDLKFDDERGLGLLDVLGKSIWTVPRNQTLYRDLFRIEKINQQIEWKVRLLELLTNIFKELPQENHKAELKEFCLQIAEIQAESISVSTGDYFKNELYRIERLYDKELTHAINKEMTIFMYFIIDNILGIKEERPLRVEMISPATPQEELSGVALGNFGGLVDKELMIHDFEVGCKYGYHWLNKEFDRLQTMKIEAMNIPADVQDRIIKKLINNAVSKLIDEFEAKRPFFGSAGEGSLSAYKYLKMFAGALIKHYWKEVLFKVKTLGR